MSRKTSVKKKTTTRIPLEKLPKAKGRPRGRRCYVCRKVQDIVAFQYVRAAETLSRTHRTCIACVAVGRSKVFKHKCPACGKATKSSSNRPTMCSDACRARGIKNSEKRRNTRRKTRASRRSRAIRERV